METFSSSLIEFTSTRPDWQARFWSKVLVIDDEDSCWPWQGATTYDGYGLLRFTAQDGRTPAVMAHRVGYVAQHGEYPDDHIRVCHTCDNRICERGSHFFLGTPSENSKDMWSKGRGAIGSALGLSPLTEASVLEMRELYAEGWSQPELAARYRISSENVSAVVRHLTWKHVGGPPARKTKLTPEDVRLIRRLYSARNVTQRELGDKFGVHPNTISAVITGANHAAIK